MMMYSVPHFCKYFGSSTGHNRFYFHITEHFCNLFVSFFYRPSDSSSRSDIIFDNGDESIDEMSQVALY